MNCQWCGNEVNTLNHISELACSGKYLICDECDKIPSKELIIARKKGLINQLQLSYSASTLRIKELKEKRKQYKIRIDNLKDEITQLR